MPGSKHTFDHPRKPSGKHRPRERARKAVNGLETAVDVAIGCEARQWDTNAPVDPGPDANRRERRRYARDLSNWQYQKDLSVMKAEDIFCQNQNK